MANFKKGETVFIREDLVAGIKLVNLIVGGKLSDCFGEVVEVNPTTEEIKKYKEINPLTDGNNKVIYFDKKAERHFIMPTEALVVGEQ